MEALGQDVDEEAADELADVERHRGVAAGPVDAVVLDLEGDALLFTRTTLKETRCVGNTGTAADQ